MRTSFSISSASVSYLGHQSVDRGMIDDRRREVGWRRNAGVGGCVEQASSTCEHDARDDEPLRDHDEGSSIPWPRILPASARSRLPLIMPRSPGEGHLDECPLHLQVGSRLMKEVRPFKTTTEAHFVAGLLDSQGIPCEVREGALESFGRGEPGQPFYPSVWVLRDEDFAAESRSSMNTLARRLPGGRAQNASARTKRPSTPAGPAARSGRSARRRLIHRRPDVAGGVRRADAHGRSHAAHGRVGVVEGRNRRRVREHGPGSVQTLE